VSLSKDPVFSLLKSRFVCGWRDISKESYAGVSSAHELDNPGVVTSNGAGGHNIQLFFLAPDGTVLQCMPGYWAAQDLALIIEELVEPLAALWAKKLSVSRRTKNERYANLQRGFLTKHNARMAKRSRMQGFDVKFELTQRLETTDCVHRDASGAPILGDGRRAKTKYKMKNTLEIALGRMAVRPFVSYERFDVAAFSDYGRKRYDKKGDGGGEERMGAERTRRKKGRGRRGASGDDVSGS
jgi:hypothetical protein